jgi:hypothetical protein
MPEEISRREFLKSAGLGLAGLALPLNFNFRPWQYTRAVADFPDAPNLARVAVGAINLRSAPSIDAAEIDVLYEDAVVPWLREVVGYNPYRHNQNFIETPEGYIWSAFIQPVWDLPQEPLAELPVQPTLGKGMWVRVRQPYVDVLLENATPYAFFVKLRVEAGLLPRLYYDQVFWVNDLRVDNEGQTWYRLDQKWDRGDVFWGPAEAFQPMTEADVEPYSPGVEDKVLQVNLNRQTVSAFEEGREVYFCRCSTGQLGEQTQTPVNIYGFPIWRKMVSAYMEGNVTGVGYGLAGIGFTTLFTSSGIALHSTFWHNNYGEPTSHGCVNLAPKDAEWIFRWTNPVVGYDPGDVTIAGEGSTKVVVLEN